MAPTSISARAWSLRQEAEAHARQRIPLADISHARVLDEALAITSDNLARALAELDALKTSAAAASSSETA
jgi:hypothetical protein